MNAVTSRMRRERDMLVARIHAPAHTRTPFDHEGVRANDCRSAPNKTHETPDVRHTVSELRDCTGYTNTIKTMIKERRGSHHRVSSGGFD